MTARPELAVVLVGMSSPGYPSLALGYVRAYAQAYGPLKGRVGFTTIELDHDTDPWWVAYRVLGLEPDVVGFSVTCWNANAVYAAARTIVAARPGTFVVLGGPEVGPLAETVVAAHPAVGAVVRGEGEATFAALLEARLTGAPAWGVEGVTARQDSNVVSAPDRALIADLDSIPSPLLTGLLPAVDGASYIEGYRGCPYRCGYCFEGKGYGRVRHFSRERVAAEIDFLARAPEVRSFSFIDPVFNLTEERLEWLTSCLEPHARDGVRLHTIEVNIERIGPREASMLRRAGVASVETGPQTTGVTALAECKRTFDPQRFSAGVRACRAEGITVECDLIVGLPGDGVADVMDGLGFAVALDPGKVRVSTLHVLPGTDLWDRADELGLTYDPEPPHEIVATRQMDFARLRQVEVYGVALSKLYAARLPVASVREECE